MAVRKYIYKLYRDYRICIRLVVPVFVLVYGGKAGMVPTYLIPNSPKIAWLSKEIFEFLLYFVILS
jgi:hypothetical protein